MKNTLISAAVILSGFLGISLNGQDEIQSSTPLRLTFAEPLHFQYANPDNRWRAISARTPQIDLLISNTGSDDIRILDQTSMWGINAVSFTLKGIEGREWKIVRRFEIFGSQSPDAVILRPNDSMVLRVNFDDEGWSGFPNEDEYEYFDAVEPDGVSIIWTLQAHYEGVACPFGDLLQNWVGSVSSDWIEFHYYPN